MSESTVEMTEAEVIALGESLFGADRMQWRFRCPSCGHEASAQDYKDAGAPAGAVGYSCIGRWAGGDDAKTFKRAGGPCTYAGGGLFSVSKVVVVRNDGERMGIFEFAAPGAAHA